MRITFDEWALELAKVTAKRGTCIRRQVGCILVNNRGHIISTGYNGVASGLPHCNKHDEYDPIGFTYACSGAFKSSGEGLDECQAIHAEQNALLQCNNVYDIEAAYTTTSPCITCVKLLLNTSCQRIVFLEEYPHSESKDLWINAGRKWVHITESSNA